MILLCLLHRKTTRLPRTLLPSQHTAALVSRCSSSRHPSDALDSNTHHLQWVWQLVRVIGIVAHPFPHVMGTRFENSCPGRNFFGGELWFSAALSCAPEEARSCAIYNESQPEKKPCRFCRSQKRQWTFTLLSYYGTLTTCFGKSCVRTSFSSSWCRRGLQLNQFYELAKQRSGVDFAWLISPPPQKKAKLKF